MVDFYRFTLASALSVELDIDLAEDIGADSDLDVASTRRSGYSTRPGP
ncbi:MAG TPA: hypothetical protein VEB21_01915 [Terriglobales bacterium]|nr:hypothetical protein [Terriglobales bacterium]